MQKPNRPLDLEQRSLDLAGNLLHLCLKDSSKKLKEYVRQNYGDSFSWAKEILKEGTAFAKMKEIIKEQGGKTNIDSEDLKPGKFSFKIRSTKNGTVKSINIKNLTVVAKFLGAPLEKGAGIYLDKKIGEKSSSAGCWLRRPWNCSLYRF